MLHEICRVGGYQDDDFIGLKFIDGKPQLTFPRGFVLSSNEIGLRKDAVCLLSAIQKFTSRIEGEKGIRLQSNEQSTFPLQSYQYIILDYLQNGYYIEKEIRYVSGTRGRINWKRTIQQKQSLCKYSQSLCKKTRNKSANGAYRKENRTGNAAGERRKVR